MIKRLLLVLLALAATPLSAEGTARIVYVGIEDDPWYEPQPVYTGLSLRDRERPTEAAELAIREARVLSRAIGFDFALDVRLVQPGDGAAAAQRAFDEGALAVVLDLPAAELEGLALPTDGSLALDIRQTSDRLRGSDCIPGVLHTMPSRAMLSDALAQFLAARGWHRILLLHGQSEDDGLDADAARRSLAKFGLRLEDDRTFELTNDPRRRDASNIALLTGGRYDVVWLIDNEGEFGRYVPYATYAARPIVGSEGLTPIAWHWTYERHGAPQLNQRFRRTTDRNMTSLDWAAWVAVRAVIAGVQKTESIDRATVAALVQSDDLSLDLYKGAAGSFRQWSGQLRQPILLATHNAVIEWAPLAGFEHRTDTLDTLGIDVEEGRCDK